MRDSSISEQDRRRRRALIVLQVVCYGYLLAMFLVQLRMAAVRNW